MVFGSRAYKLETEASDYDYAGVVIPPKEYILGALDNFDCAEVNIKEMSAEYKIHDLRKFVHLACDNNPNILEMLWVEKEDLLFSTNVWSKFLDVRHKFTSQRIKKSYAGYAYAQIKRMETHRKWLLDPPVAPPSRSDFGLPEHSLLRGEIRGIFTAIADRNGVPVTQVIQEMLDGKIMEVYHQELLYSKAKAHWDSYQNWKKNRNPKRAQFEALVGYDCKHASQVIRLLMVCLEALEKSDGTINLTLDEARRERIMQIKTGNVQYRDLVEQSSDLMKQLESTKSTLPMQPDRNAVNDILIEVMESSLVESSSLGV